jgi:ubiquitin-activating enzyme E1
VQISDLATNFYLNESQVGKISRAEATVGQLKELNPYTEINVMKTEPTDELIKQFSVVYVTELILPLKRIKAIDALCRSAVPAIGFIFTLALGLYGCTFVDFGQKFTIKDARGENLSSYNVVLVSQANPGIVMIHEDKKHNFAEGDYVKFREIEGMNELNNTEPIQIKVVDKFSFSIGDTTKFKPYTKYFDSLCNKI